MSRRVALFGVAIGGVLATAAVVALLLEDDRASRGGRESGSTDPGRTSDSGCGCESETETAGAPGSDAEKRRRVIDLLAAIDACEDLRAAQKLHGELLRRIPGMVLDDALRNKLLDLVSEGNERWRPIFGDIIGRFGDDPAMSKQLVAILQRWPANRNTRKAVLIALGSMPAGDAPPELMRLIGTGLADEELIVRAIGQIGGTGALKGLLSHLGAPCPAATRVEIEAALIGTRDKEVLAMVAVALATATPATRESLLRILSRTASHEHGSAVATLLEQELPEKHRKSVIETLGKFEDLESALVLVRLMNSGNPKDERAAARAIGEIRNGKTLDALAAEPLSPKTQLVVLEASRRLTAPGDNLVDLALLRLTVRRGRKTAIAVLGKARRESTIGPLIALLSAAPDVATRTAVFEALLAIRTRKAAEQALASLPLLQDETARKRLRSSFEALLSRYDKPSGARK